MNFLNERMKARGQGGFTLIELLVVIAILGILAGVVVFAVGNLTDDAQDNACAIELRTIQTAASAAETDADVPSPTNVNDLVAAGYLVEGAIPGTADTLGTYTVAGANVTPGPCPA